MAPTYQNGDRELARRIFDYQQRELDSIPLVASTDPDRPVPEKKSERKG